MNDLKKVLILIAVIIYVISPVDLCPGPIDEIILVICAYVSQRRVVRWE